MKTRVLICGSRTWNRPFFVKTLVLWLIHYKYGADGFVIVHGAAKGVDTYAGQFGEQYGVEVEAYPVDWSKGAYAGPLRNTQMLDTGIDVVHAIGYGSGTANCCKQATERGIPVIWRYWYNDAES